MIPSVAVDTDVVSFEFKQDSRSTLYDAHLTDRLLVISFTTVAELYQWAQIYKWEKSKRERLEKYLKGFVIFHSDHNLCLKWAEVKSNARKQGRPIETADAWIVATALLHNIPLVTHNNKHYKYIEGLTIISEANS